MDHYEMLHIVRNPHGFDPEIVRIARIQACNLIERQEKELSAYKAAWEDIKGLTIHRNGYATIDLCDINKIERKHGIGEPKT